MANSALLRAGLSALALVAAGSAQAEVTANDVWTAMRDQMTIYGPDVLSVGSEEMSGDTLTVTGVALNTENAGATSNAEIGTVTFTENGDGTVTMVMPEEILVTTSPNGKTDTDRVVILLRLSGNSTVVGGTPEEMTYDLSADRYSISVEEAFEEGKAIPLELLVNLNNVASSYTMTQGDLRQVTGSFGADGLDIFLDATDEAAGNQINLSGQTSGVTMAMDASIPAEFDPENPADMFDKGYAADISMASATSQYLATVTDATGPTNIVSSSTEGRFAMRFGKEGMAIDMGGKTLAQNITGPQLPFPVDLTLAEYGLSLDTPVSKSEEPAPFAAQINLTDLTVNDMIWQMFDPGSVLPRDPATLLIDLSGTAKLLFDMLNPIEAAAAEEAGAPGELHSLTLNQLRLAFAGALLTGNGDFTFDNTDTVTFDGMPRPEGMVSLQATGLNGLMDKLVQMGLVPEEQMMGTRMMLGMFATVTGEDQLTSTIEVNAEGHVMANGQRIR